MRLRQDKCYVGTEEIEVKDTQKNLYFEAALFFLIGAAFLFFFFRYFRSGRLDSIPGAFIILILSPFGAHLSAKMFGFLRERLGLK